MEEKQKAIEFIIFDKIDKKVQLREKLKTLDLAREIIQELDKNGLKDDTLLLHLNMVIITRLRDKYRYPFSKEVLEEIDKHAI